MGFFNSRIGLGGKKLRALEVSSKRLHLALRFYVMYVMSFGGCCDVFDKFNMKNWFLQKVNARHPLEFSREELSKNFVACSQPETSSLHNLNIRSEGPTRHVMSGCVGSPTNGSENGRMAIGRGDASIGPSWAPCEVSAELSIVGAASGGSDVGGGASQSSQVWSQARLATRTVLRVIQGGRLSTCCAATQGDVLRAQRRVSGEGAALIWVGVAGECPAW